MSRKDLHRYVFVQVWLMCKNVLLFVQQIFYLPHWRKIWQWDCASWSMRILIPWAYILWETARLVCTQLLGEIFWTKFCIYLRVDDFLNYMFPSKWFFWRLLAWFFPYRVDSTARSPEHPEIFRLDLLVLQSRKVYNFDWKTRAFLTHGISSMIFVKISDPLRSILFFRTSTVLSACGVS